MRISFNKKIGGRHLKKSKDINSRMTILYNNDNPAVPPKELLPRELPWTA